MHKKNILLILPGVWSMGKGIGMPSVHNFIECLQKEFNIIFITPDNSVIQSDYPNAKIIYTTKLKTTINNKYVVFAINRINYCLSSIQVVLEGIRNKGCYDLIYANYAIPGAKILSLVFRKPLVIRAYGTFLYASLGKFWRTLVKYEELFLFKTKADLYVITNDGTSGDKVADYYGIPDNKVLFLVNGIDQPKVEPTKYTRSNLNIPKDAIVLLTTSRLVHWKRVDRIIGAVTKVSSANLFLIVAGDGEERKKLEFIANGDKRILFMGAVNPDVVSDLFLLSNWYVSMYDVSNVGNPLLQALTYGMPILTCSSGNTKEFVNEGLSNGICLQFDSEEELMKSLQECLLSITNDPLSYDVLRVGSKNAGDKLLTWPTRIALEIDHIKKLI